MTEIPFLKLDLESKEIVQAKEELHGEKFPEKMLMMLSTPEIVANFLSNYPHRKLDYYHTISCSPTVYEVVIDGKEIGVCQTPLGAPAAVQLEEFLIAGGAKKIIACGSSGIIGDIDIESLFVVKRAIRDEGTSYHYLPPRRYIELNNELRQTIENNLLKMNIAYKKVATWTTDGVFRETQTKVDEFAAEGVTNVEMECAGLAACAEFRKVEFAQILFTADSLKNNEHDKRDWGAKIHPYAVDVAAQVLANIH